MGTPEKHLISRITSIFGGRRIGESDNILPPKLNQQGGKKENLRQLSKFLSTHIRGWLKRKP